MVIWIRFFCLFFIISTAAHSQERSPIRYEVNGNNRIFIEREGERFVRDLNKYIRCTAFTRGRQAVDKSDLCNDYRKQGTNGGKLVPNLRAGELNHEYQIQYNKVSGNYPQRYASDSRRVINLFIDSEWRSLQTSAPMACKWIVTTPNQQQSLSVEGCGPVAHQVNLSLSAAGDTLEWTAHVRLSIRLFDGTELEYEAPISVRDYLIVAMGDSLTSGEGNPERNWTKATPAQWMDYRCHRSLFSYPVMMAATLALADPRHSITLVHVACSGAQIEEGILDKYSGAITRTQAIAIWKRGWFNSKRMQVPDQWEQYGTELEYFDSQIDQVRRALTDAGRTRKPDLLILSIGVNDVGFVQLLEKLALTNCQEKCFDQLRQLRNSSTATCGSTADKLTRSFGCLEQLLRNLKNEIEQKIGPRQTYLIEYPNPLRDEDGRLCMSQPHHGELLKGVLGTFGNMLSVFWSPKLSLQEITYAEAEFFNPLKQAHLNINSAPNWLTIEHQGAEDKRGFCASPKWYHSYQESQLRQHLNPNSRTDSVGTLHPNAIGHEHLMVRVLARLRRDRILVGHNFSLLEPSDFHKSPRVDGQEGLAWILGRIHEEDVTRYYKF
jgi:lysophospholipase L1-like esterase